MRGIYLVLGWLSAFALWWLLVGTWQVWNLVWGLGLATVVTVGGAVVGAGRADGRFRMSWLPELGSAAVQVVPDFGVLVAELARAVASGDRGPRGRFLTRSTDATGPGGATRRAWVTLVATWSPNAYVLDVDEDSGGALVHDLRPRRRSEEPA